MLTVMYRGHSAQLRRNDYRNAPMRNVGNGWQRPRMTESLEEALDSGLEEIVELITREYNTHDYSWRIQSADGAVLWEHR